MAFRYWAAGVSGNWNSILSWSTSATGTPAGATVPGAADDVFFNAASGTVTATLDISPTVQSVNCTGFTGTLAFGTNTISLNSTGTVFTGATTMTVTGTPQIILTNNSATARTISPQAVTEANSISFRITAGTGTLNINTGGIRDLDFTDGVNPTGYAGAYQNSIPTIYGNFKASTGMTKVAGTGTFTFAATSGTKTITTAAVVFDNPFTFNGVGGTWQLQDALTSGATRNCTLSAGTLDLNNFTLTTGLFSSNTTSTRVLAFGTGNITVTGVSGTVFFGPSAASTGLTTTGTAQVNVTGNGTTTRTISPGNPAAITGFISFTVSAGSDTISSGVGQTFNNLTFTSGFTGTFANVTRAIFGNLTLDANTNLASGASTLTFNGTGSRTITTAGKTLDFPVTFNGVGGAWAMQDALTLGSTQPLTFANGTLQLAAGTTNTVGSFVTSGTTLKYLQSTISGTQSTISQASGTVTATYLSVQDSNATGGATWNATASTNVYVTNNTGWNFGTLAALSGVAATIAVGSLIYTIPISLSGTQATSAVGSLGFANAYALSSVLSTTDVGSVTPRFTVGTTGVQATSAVGSVVWGNAYALSGVQATGSVGSFSFTSTIPMSGVLATGSVQTIFGFGWGAIPDTSESWGAIPDTSETWTVIGNTSETWTPISSTS